mmetsp:Transcript_31613/g.60816  ORF Transcript_31613/g.60816 Transcript_31613/m.60816 type:complete len:119 (-) Transcript_31613:21-377(-)
MVESSKRQQLSYGTARKMLREVRNSKHGTHLSCANCVSLDMGYLPDADPRALLCALNMWQMLAKRILANDHFPVFCRDIFYKTCFMVRIRHRKSLQSVFANAIKDEKRAISWIVCASK